MVLHDFLVEQALLKVKFKEIVEEIKVMLKRLYKNLFEKLHQHNIPVFMF